MLELLIVDDEEMVRESLAMLFRREGFAVATAGTGEAAIAAASQQSFDIVISDIRMPGADGIEVVQRIRELQPNTHFVLITGFASEEATVEALRLKVDDYFRKPFDLPTFVERIRAIGRSRLRSGPDAAQGLRRFAEILREAWPAWGEHADRAAVLCEAVGRRLGLSEEELTALRLAGLFHDLRNVEGGAALPTAGEGEGSGMLERTAVILSGGGEPASQVLTAAVAWLAGGWEAVSSDGPVREALAAAVAERPPAPARQPVAPEASPLVIRTLGALSVTVQGAEVARADWESASARNLFILLLCDRGRRVSEDRIVEAFWPDGDAERARRSMKTAVYRVRKALRAPDVVLTGERYYSFNAALPHWWDLPEMERAAARARALEAAHDAGGALREWKQAAALYRGAFLEGMEHDWIQPVRDRARETALEARTRGAALHLQLGDAAGAVAQARAALDLDRACEEAQALLVRALGAAGRRDEAVRAYHAAVETLSRMLGLGPGPQLARAYLEVTSES